MNLPNSQPSDSQNSPPNDPYFEQRRCMVRDQLQRRGISDARVLGAMLEVPRHVFVPEDVRGESYEDGPLPIGYGQTISQPYTVAYMAETARIKPTDRVLEIGTGSGYGAAILSRLAAEVFTVERITPLGTHAARQLRQQGYRNVRVFVGDGTRGISSFAPFDVIIVTAASEELPSRYKEQVKPGGRILIPLGGRDGQRMTLFTRHDDGWTEEDCGGFAFVPLIAQSGGDVRVGEAPAEPKGVNEESPRSPDSSAG